MEFHKLIGNRHLGRFMAGNNISTRRAYSSDLTPDQRKILAAPTGGYSRYDVDKKILGRKRHILVDTLGLVIVVHVTAASVSDAAGAIVLLRQVSRFDQPRLETLFVNQAYHRAELYAFAAQHFSCRLQVGNRPLGAVGFVPIRKRWVVERTFGWLAHHRHHARDYERTYASSEAQVYLSQVRVLLRRLEKSTTPDNSGPASTAAIHAIAA